MALGEFALTKQHLEAALVGPDISPSYIDPAADHDIYAMLVDAAVRQKEVDALRRYASPAEETAAQYDHTLYRAIAHRALGVLHRLETNYAESTIRLDQALAIFDQLGTRWQIGRTCYELGQLAQDQKDVAGAQAYFSRALEAFETLGAQPDAARVRAMISTM